jgi:hypothetical protein
VTKTPRNPIRIIIIIIIIINIQSAILYPRTNLSDREVKCFATLSVRHQPRMSRLLIFSLVVALFLSDGTTEHCTLTQHANAPLTATPPCCAQ